MSCLCHLSLDSGVVSCLKDTVALMAAEAGLVESHVVHTQTLHSVNSLAASGTLFAGGSFETHDGIQKQ